MPGALFGLAYSAPALTFLKTLQPKMRRQIIKRIEALVNDPRPANCKQLQNVLDGEDSVHRVRQGPYRILYAVRNNPDQIAVLDIGHRKDVYR